MIIIHDKARAIQEKAEVDAHNKRLLRPVKILACITAGIILLAVATTVLSKANLIHYACVGVSIVIAILSSVALFVFWGIRVNERQLYSANVQYYLATNGKTVKCVNITPETRFSMEQLAVYVEDGSHGGKEFTKRSRKAPRFSHGECVKIEFSNMGVKRGISEDIIDLVEPLQSPHRECWQYGYWYEPFERKVKELESRVIDTKDKPLRFS